jgi:hypothetical protein
MDNHKREVKLMHFYIKKHDSDRIDRLANLTTPLDPNRSRIVREAVNFALFHPKAFGRFVRNKISDTKEE